MSAVAVQNACATVAVGRRDYRRVCCCRLWLFGQACELGFAVSQVLRGPDEAADGEKEAGTGSRR